ncbi:MAG: beta-galactosidase [Bacteroidetes bacterium]|nr:MAG: beta-galactosidase [Bacteroidota bacterium]
MMTATARILLITLLTFTFSGLLPGQQSSKVYLSGTGFDHTKTWDFYCSDGMNSGKWSSIEVPSCWEQQGFGNYQYGLLPFDERKKEEGHYRLSFWADRSWKGQAIRLVFEGVMTDCRVMLNGKPIGDVHQGAFYPFSYDLAGHLRFGKENTLDVYVKKFSDDLSVSEAERYSDYWVFGGIFRPVYLELSPVEHIAHVAVDARADGSLKADVELKGSKRARKLELKVLDDEGRQCAVFSAHIAEGEEEVALNGKMKVVRPWSPEYPFLYNLNFNLLDGKGDLLHRHVVKAGFRTIEFRAEDGIYVNGSRIKFKGVNRHSFHPDYGRTSCEAYSAEVVNLIKDMNMNAVRMSHYPPDGHFLDACDSLGLFVLDELAGWQSPPYDSAVGRALLEAMIRRDVNHPSVIMWDNGNEGGWNRAYDEAFAELDIQKRHVNHPWAVHGPSNTAHYIDYDYLGGDHFARRKVFYPTEMIHGLYDGGHGAGLEDYWLRMWNDPLCAGGFLWVFADEAIKRVDTGAFDTDGNHAPDGILGPYHEKEGSFYTIREVWSPVFFEKRFITPDFNGQFRIQNRFHFTALDQCRFDYVWLDIPGPDEEGKKTAIIGQGEPRVDPLIPGQNGSLSVPLSEGWREAELLQINAYDPHGRLINRWSWPVQSPEGHAMAVIPKADGHEAISVEDSEGFLSLRSGSVQVRIDKRNGLLSRVTRDGTRIPLSRGPVVRDDMPEMTSFRHYESAGNHLVKVEYGDQASLEWTFHPGGLLDMTIAYQPGGRRVPYTGVSFDFPEREDLSLRYLGKGPYRVWKNRMKGGVFGIWDKKWNNTITGHSGYDYPEFKGCYANLYWADFRYGSDSQFRVYSRTDDLFLRLYSPGEAPVPGHTAVEFPSGDISFMLGIPAIGSKFRPVEEFGPLSKDYYYSARRVEGASLKIDLSFDFR